MNKQYLYTSPTRLAFALTKHAPGQFEIIKAVVTRIGFNGLIVDCKNKGCVYTLDVAEKAWISENIPFVGWLFENDDRQENVPDVEYISETKTYDGFMPITVYHLKCGNALFDVTITEEILQDLRAAEFAQERVGQHLLDSVFNELKGRI